MTKRDESSFLGQEVEARARQEDSAKELHEQASRLGYRVPQRWPDPPSPSFSDSSMEFDLEALATSDFERREGTALTTVCTVDHLPHAHCLVSSALELHPELDAYVLVVDWDGTEPLQVPGAELLSGRQIGIDRFGFLCLKYTPAELCCAAKPYLLRYLIAVHTHRHILYLDSDIYVFGPLDTILDRLEQHDFVVTPHILVAPLPQPERVDVYPTMAHLAAAGVLNAGLFGVSITTDSVRFIEKWRQMVSGPNSFLDHRGLDHEQGSFNWIISLVDNVHVLRDPAYNVAYWNLHERSLRFRGLDDETLAWTVDGRPLVAFHFSGFSLSEPLRLSAHENRSSLYLLPSVAHLVRFYTEKLVEAGADPTGSPRYAYGHFSSGTPISPEMRTVFKRYETYLWRPLDPFTQEGEEHYAASLLLPVASAQSFLPILLKEHYDKRPDLQEYAPGADLHPSTLIRWFVRWGAEAFDLEELFCRHSPLLPKLEAVQQLSELVDCNASLFRDLPEPLTRGRSELLRRLDRAGLDDQAEALRRLDYEHFALSPIYLVRKLIEERPTLRTSFPDFLGRDSARFAEWLAEFGVSAHFLSPSVSEIFAQKAAGRSLARIFSYANRTWPIMEQWPLAFVGIGKEEFAAALLGILRHCPEYDADDVLMYLWSMDECPWVGLPLTFELAINARRSPSPLEPEGQEELLQPVSSDARFRTALSDYRKRFDTTRHRQILQHVRSYRRTVPVLDDLAARFRATIASTALPSSPSANLFGYFKSPIGLGTLSRGLAHALRTVGVDTTETILGNTAMDADLSPEDYIRTYDPRLPVNVFVSYPHLHENLLELYPDHVTRDSLNVVYLAWEQRDGSPYWPEVYSGFQQIWALSEFAAESFRRHMKRPVLTVPCVLDCASLPAPRGKEDLGLSEETFAFLFAFDANSSIERKNPEAVVDAFRRAFRKDDPVRLLIRASNSHRLEHRERLGRLVGAAEASGLDIAFRFDDMTHDELLQLLSAVDCYVSLHRSEGFGYTCAEAMAYGVPVIATNYSGNLDFMTTSNSYLVDYIEAEVGAPDGPFQLGSVWADPSIDHAAELMRSVFLDREQAAAVGSRGRETVLQLLSPERVGRLVFGALFGDAAPDSAARSPSRPHAESRS